MKGGEKYEEIELVKKDKNDEKLSDGEDLEMKLVEKDETDEKSYAGEDSEMKLVEKDETDEKSSAGEDSEMELVKKDETDETVEKPSDGEEREEELMRKSKYDAEQTDGEDDEIELVKKDKNNAKLSDGEDPEMELVKKEETDEQPSAGEDSEVAELKLNKTAEDLSKKERENLILSCQLTAQDLKQKELKKHCDDLKKENEDMLQIIKKNQEDLSNLQDLKKLCDDLKKENEKIIKENKEELRNLQDLKKLCGDLKKENEKVIKENKEVAKGERIIHSTLRDKEAAIQKLHEDLQNLVEANEKHKTENAKLRAELVAKDEILKEHEETLPKIIQGSPLQWVHDSIPACMQTCLAPKGSITGDELGTFMGSLVTTTAYNVTYSNSDMTEFLFWSSFANLIGSMFGQICNNIVTQMSQTDMKNEGVKKIIGKSVFWILLGGLVPIFAGGFIKKYWVRLIVTAASALVMKCGATTLWKRSYEIPMWQPVLIVVLGITGISLAAGIPHLVKVVSKKK